MASAWAHGHGWARCGAPLRPQLPRHAPVMAHASNGTAAVGTLFLFFGKKLWLFIYGLFI